MVAICLFSFFPFCNDYNSHTSIYMRVSAVTVVLFFVFLVSFLFWAKNIGFRSRNYSLSLAFAYARICCFFLFVMCKLSHTFWVLNAHLFYSPTSFYSYVTDVKRVILLIVSTSFNAYFSPSFSHSVWRSRFFLDLDIFFLSTRKVLKLTENMNFIEHKITSVQFAFLRFTVKLLSNRGRP